MPQYGGNRGTDRARKLGSGTILQFDSTVTGAIGPACFFQEEIGIGDRIISEDETINGIVIEIISQDELILDTVFTSVGSPQVFHILTG